MTFLRRDPDVIERVITQLNTTDKSSIEVAQEAGISRQTVARIAQDHGVDLNARRGVWANGDSHDLWIAIRTEIESTGDPLPVIADRLGTSMHRIYSLASDYKYSLRGCKERRAPDPYENTRNINQLWRPAAVRGN